jgi:hypothetical protein
VNPQTKPGVGERKMPKNPEGTGGATGWLQNGEAHPAALDALQWLRGLSPQEMSVAMESLSSCALEGNRLGEVCLETLRRLQEGDAVSDRYVLGLAWALHSISGDSVSMPKQAIATAIRALHWAKPCCDRSIKALVEEALLGLEGLK